MANDVEIRIRVRDQTAAGFGQAEGRARTFGAKFAAEGDRAGQGFSRGVRSGLGGIGGAISSLSVAGVVAPLVIGLAGSIQQLAGAGLLLPGALGAGAGIIGTLKMALSGVGEALTATAGGAASTGQSVAAMARQIRDANRAIERANQGVIDANRRLEDAHRGVERALRRVDDANRSVADAQRDYARAQADEQRALASIDDARRDAIRTLEDLAEAQDDSVRSVEGAELALKRAIADQQKTMKDSKATALDRAEAAFRVKEAEDRLSDAQRESTQVTEKLADAQAKGVDGSDQVVAAQQAAADAHDRTQQAAERVADAERGVADAQEGVADAQRDVADAERGVLEAKQAVADAVQNLNDVYAQQAEQAAKAAGGVDAYAAALAKLSPNAREFVKVLRDELGPEWDKIQRNVQDRVFEGLAQDARELGDKYLPVLAAGLGGIADEINDIVRDTADGLMDPASVEAVNTVLANTAGFLDEAQTALGDFVVGFLNLAAIGSEYLPGFGQQIADIAAGFKAWTENDPEAVREWIDGALQGLSDLWAIGENVVGIISAIASGLAGGTDSGGTFLGTIADLTASLQEFVESEGVQGFLATVGWIVQKMIEWAPVTITIIGAILLLKGTVDLVVGAINLWKDAQWLLNLAMAANPTVIVIAAIVALIGAFIWAWNNIEGFREFWIGVWNVLVAAFNGAKDGIVAGWNWLMSTLSGAVSWIGGILSTMWDGLTAGLKGAVNGAISLLNGLIFGVNKIVQGLNVVNPFSDIPYVPYIPYLAKGGNASGLAMVGENGPELVRLPTGSSVVTAGDTRRALTGGDAGAPAGFEVRFGGNVDTAFATAFMQLVRTGKIQLAPVGR